MKTFITLISCLCLIVLFFVTGCSSDSRAKDPLNSNSAGPVIVVSDGIEEVRNSAVPIKGEITFNLSEELTIGSTDEVSQLDIEGNEINFFRGFEFEFDSKGFIHILDWAATDIKVFNPQGKHTKTIGGKGQGPNEFYFPNYFHVLPSDDVGILYIGNTYKLLSRSGEFLSMKRLGTYMTAVQATEFCADRPTQPCNFIGICIENDFKSGTKVLTLAKLDENGKILEQYLQVENKYIIFNGSEKIFVSHPGLDPDIIFSTAAGAMYAAVNHRYCINRYDLKTSRISRKIYVDLMPHKLSDKEKEDISKKNFFKYPKPIITRIKNSLTDVKPIISKISTDDQGWLYVFRKLPAKRKDDDAGYVVDIFNPEGKYLYKAQCKWPFQFVGKHLWSHTYVNDSHLLKSFKLENGFK